jgi:adenosylcobinamide-GDP ribazoletransferase
MSDGEQRRNEAPKPDELWREFATSLAFLTRLPLEPEGTPAPLSQSMRMFPAAGALIGAATGLLAALLWAGGIPPLLAATFAVAATLGLTGALHEDGIADMADGFGGGATRERKLAIMRDSRIGTFGTLALVLCLIAKITAMAVILRSLGWGAVAVLAASGAASRAGIVWLMSTTAPARSDGLSASAGQPGGDVLRAAVGIAGIVSLVLLGWTLGVLNALFVLLAGAATALAVRRLSQWQIGGQTGDVCGALQVATEIVMLTAATASLH